MKKFVIINNMNLFAVNEETLKAAEKIALMMCDGTKEIIVREIDPIFTVAFTSMLKK